MFGKPAVLEAGFVGRDHDLELVHDDGVLCVGILLTTEVRHVVLNENPEFHGWWLPSVTPVRRRNLARNWHLSRAKGRSGPNNRAGLLSRPCDQAIRRTSRSKNLP